MKIKFLPSRSVIYFCLFSLTTLSWAAEGGMSNYVPSFYGDMALAVEPPDGFSYRNDILLFSGDISPSARAGRLETDVDVTLANNYFSFLYKPKAKIFDTAMAFSITPAFATTNIDGNIRLDSSSLEFDDDLVGAGDLTLGAYFYKSHGKFNYSLNTMAVAPVGSYDKDRVANTGMNYWTFEADIAMTYYDPEKGRDYSLVFGYNYNTENQDTNYQSGDELHLDFVLNQYLSEKFGLGIAGYLYKQIGGDSGDGAVLGSFKGEGIGIGPAIYYTAQVGEKPLYCIFKWVHDVHAENRVKGDYAFLSFALSF